MDLRPEEIHVLHRIRRTFAPAAGRCDAAAKRIAAAADRVLAERRARAGGRRLRTAECLQPVPVRARRR